MENTVQKRAQEQAEESKPNLTGIPMQMKRDFESRSGLSFEDVRVHYNSDKPAQLQALAYTQGTQVYVGSGQERHLHHELGHVVQQMQGRVFPTGQIGSIPVNESPALEREADGALRATEQLGTSPPVVQKQEDLMIGCRVMVNLQGSVFTGKILKVSGEGVKTVYAIQIDDKSYKGKNPIIQLEEMYVVAQGLQLSLEQGIELAQTKELEKVTIHSREEISRLPPVRRPWDPALTKAVPALDNAMCPNTDLFHVGLKSGVLLRRAEDGFYHVVFLERNQKETLSGPFRDFNISQVYTTGISSCSFLVMTDSMRSFAVVAHLDRKDGIAQVLTKMEEYKLVPTFLFASIIDGAPNSIEVSRVFTIVQQYAIRTVQILNRGNPAAYMSNCHDIIGVDLNTAPLSAVPEDLRFRANPKPSIWGEMGSGDDVIDMNVNGWLLTWAAECIPNRILFWEGPVDSYPIQRSLSAMGLISEIPKVIEHLLKEGKGNILAGIKNCLRDKAARKRLTDLIKPSMEKFNFCWK